LGRKERPLYSSEKEKRGGDLTKKKKRIVRSCSGEKKVPFSVRKEQGAKRRGKRTKERLSKNAK